ncbi:MAG: TIGR01212 family radical SAM protein [bacterium]|nr:TIGR01212 family radical SAM protein [bacterium]
MLRELEIKHCKKGNWFGKPYYFFGDYLKNKFSCRILKLSINADFSCPNRDGSVGDSGCIFCSEEGSASPSALGFSGIPEQMDSARNSFKRSEMSTRYIAYFQAFTNTYASPERLKLVYDTAVNQKDIVGLMIGTRPDALSNEILDLIAGYASPGVFELWLEIGMQTMHEKSLAFLKRGHNHEQTRAAITAAAEREIPVCVHVILGIPGESWEDMMATAYEINSLPVSGVKLHHLHVIKDTPLEVLYQAGAVPPFSLKEYVSTLCDFIERLRPDIIIHRLMGDRNEDSLVSPRWGMHKGTVLQAIDDEFARRVSYQGFLLDDLD